MLGLDTQVLSTAVMFLTGVALALFHDLCAVAAGHARVPGAGGGRSRKRAPARAVIRLWDLIYCLLVTPVVFAATMVSNRGELRFYVFVGLALGVAAYFLLASRFVVAVTSTVRTAVIIGVVTVGRWVARPIRGAVAARGGLGRLGARLFAGIRRRPKE
jgi:spore cortex biosynthesis protein YabQ